MNKDIPSTHGGNLFEIERKYDISKANIIDFSGNINPMGVPDSLKKAIIQNIDLIGYYPDPDYLSVKHSISVYTNISSGFIVLGNGATELISRTIKHISPKKALTLGPTYSEYNKEIKNCNGILDFITLTEADNFQINTDAIINSLNSGYDLLILCNPNNPTSTLLGFDSISVIVREASKHGTFVIIDETYVEFCDDYENITAARLVNEYSNLFIIRGISKFFGTPGLRLGYGLTSNKGILNKFELEADPWYINIFASIAGEIVFRDIEYIDRSRKLMREQKQHLYTLLNQIEGIKTYKPYANFILCKLLNNALTGTELSHELIKHSILIRSTSDIKGLGDNYFRVCVLNKNDNELLCSLIDEYIKKKSN